MNLKAFGFPLPEGFPSVVGPFNVYDARVFLTQSVFDLHAINDARAERHKTEAARFDVKNARDVVVLVSANAYSQALAASALVDASRAQLDTAQALLPAGGRPEAGRPGRRHRRAPRRSAARDRAAADDGGADRVRQGQAAARAHHRPAARAGVHVDGHDQAGRLSGHHARPGARPGVQGARRLPGGPRADSGGRVESRGDRRRRTAFGPRDGRLRRHRSVGQRFARQLQRHRRAERAHLPGRQRRRAA